jgi:uncharacterized protein YjiS (DUF1127 family)
MHRAKTFDSMTAGVVFRLTRRIRTHMAQAKAGHHLDVLNDHLLRDLGLTRSEIDYVITGRRRP